jgi:hypothetical protein
VSVPQIEGAPQRKPRCMRLVADKRGVNRCTAEQAGDSELCVRHLAAAATEYEEIIATYILRNGWADIPGGIKEASE